MSKRRQRAILRQYDAGFNPGVVCRDWGIGITDLAVLLVREGRYRSYGIAVAHLRSRVSAWLNRSGR